MCGIDVIIDVTGDQMVVEGAGVAKHVKLVEVTQNAVVKGLDNQSIETEMHEKRYIQELEAYYKALNRKIDNWPIELRDQIQTTKATFLIKDL